MNNGGNAQSNREHRHRQSGEDQLVWLAQAVTARLAQPQCPSFVSSSSGVAESVQPGTFSHTQLTCDMTALTALEIEKSRKIFTTFDKDGRRHWTFVFGAASAGLLLSERGLTSIRSMRRQRDH